jgi:hypothetical protein
MDMTKSKITKSTAAGKLAKTGKTSGIELTEAQLGQAAGGLKYNIKL